MIDETLVQLGLETTWGVPVAPTAILTGVADCELEPVVDSQQVEEKRGTSAPGYRTIVKCVSGRGKLSGLPSYEQIAYALDSLFGIATPGAGPGYERVYAGLGMATARQSTIVYGGSEGVFNLTSAICKSLKLSAESGEAAKFEADFIGHSLATDALVVLEAPEVAPIMGAEFALSIGGVPFDAASFSFSLNLDSGRAIKKSLGSLNPISWQPGKKWTGQLDLSLELVAASKAILDDLLAAATPLTITLDADDGTHSLLIDFAGVPSAPKVFTDKDGVITVDLTLAPQFDAVLEDWVVIMLTNGLATLP